MKIKSVMTYNGEPIAECEWELDDRARTAQQALAAISIEDHLRAQLKIEHKIVKEEEEEEDKDKKKDKKKRKRKRKKNESEVTDGTVAEEGTTSGTGQSCDCPIQSEEGSEHDRMESEAEIDEDTGGADTIPLSPRRSESDD